MIRSHGLLACFAVLATYFGLLLVPEWWPGFAGNGLFLLYVLSVPVVLIGLLGCLVWGGVGTTRALLRGSLVSPRHRALVLLPLAGFLMAGAAIGLARSIRGALPSGSHLQEFEPVVWQRPASSEFVRGDITPRQKMLGSIVDRLAPTHDRAQLEALLGPSLDTRYFESTGRDLVYILGPERDSFIGIDSEWLLIWLDDSNHFERYEVLTD